MSEFILYTSDDGKTHLNLRLENETIWLTQLEIADLFQTSKQNVSLHAKNIFDEQELDTNRTVKDSLTVQKEGEREVKRSTFLYNLDLILAIGFRVRSQRGTQFRRWANTTLKEYIVKGFVMDDERLKNPQIEGSSPAQDHFSEMLDRIRDIRASERRMYLRVREIFVLAADYVPSSKDTIKFFKAIQNKLHFATTGMTAAELIAKRADHSQPNMGLTVWKGEIVLQSDVTIAKNYLQEDEVQNLNRIVTMWLDFSEDQAIRRKQIFLKNWQEKLDSFLEFNEREVLTSGGNINKTEADKKAKQQYQQFSTQRRTELEDKGAKDTLDLLSELQKNSNKLR